MVKRVTLKTIAHKTGYSVTTVSRALAGYNDVSPTTRAEIIAAAQELGYYPNITARQLQKQSTDTIGIILPTFGPRFADPYINMILIGMGDELAERGLDLLVSTRSPGPEELGAYRSMVEGHRVDGLVVIRTRQYDERIAYLAERGFPFVVFGRAQMDIDFHYIDEDGFAGMYDLIQYMLSLGHERIAYISGPEHLMFSHYRLEGCRAALQDAGLTLSDNLLVYGNLTRQGGKAVAEELLKQTPRPTAIVAANDLMALGAISALQEAGLVPGQDISITGFDDIALAEYLGLTTLRQPIYDIGRQLCRMLTTLIRGDSIEPQHVLLKPELIVRNSTAVPSG